MLAAFVGISIVVIVTPGQDTALTIQNAAGRKAAGVQDRRGSRRRAGGLGAGDEHRPRALIVAFEPAFVALKLAGAAFLIYLGARARCARFEVRRPRRGRADAIPRFARG